MEIPPDFRLTTNAQLRSIIGDPGDLVPKKVMRALDEMAMDFIRRSPFLVLASTDADGNLDASPKGGNAGFVAIEDELTLAIPDRKGNKLIFGLQNILANPHVGLIFLIPGTGETLRVNGTAELTADPVVLEKLSARGQPAVVDIRVTVQECFLHCAKAFLRAQLWQPAGWPPRQPLSFGKILAPRIGGDEALAQKIDQLVEEDY